MELGGLFPSFVPERLARFFLPDSIGLDRIVLYCMCGHNQLLAATIPEEASNFGDLILELAQN